MSSKTVFSLIDTDLLNLLTAQSIKHVYAPRLQNHQFGTSAEADKKRGKRRKKKKKEKERDKEKEKEKG